MKGMKIMKPAAPEKRRRYLQQKAVSPQIHTDGHRCGYAGEKSDG